MDYAMRCPCTHTFELHDSTLGCASCSCTRDRLSCLDAVVALARWEDAPRSVRANTSPEESTAHNVYNDFVPGNWRHNIPSKDGI
jgi:hypothetical protein